MAVVIALAAAQRSFSRQMERISAHLPAPFYLYCLRLISERLTPCCFTDVAKQLVFGCLLVVVFFFQSISIGFISSSKLDKEKIDHFWKFCHLKCDQDGKLQSSFFPGNPEVWFSVFAHLKHGINSLEKGTIGLLIQRDHAGNIRTHFLYTFYTTNVIIYCLNFRNLPAVAKHVCWQVPFQGSALGISGL